MCSENRYCGKFFSEKLFHILVLFNFILTIKMRFIPQNLLVFILLIRNKLLIDQKVIDRNKITEHSIYIFGRGIKFVGILVLRGYIT